MVEGLMAISPLLYQVDCKPFYVTFIKINNYLSQIAFDLLSLMVIYIMYFVIVNLFNQEDEDKGSLGYVLVHTPNDRSASEAMVYNKTIAKHSNNIRKTQTSSINRGENMDDGLCQRIELSRNSLGEKRLRMI